MRTHTVADLIGPLALGTSAVSVIALVLAFADADLAYFDPRPALARLVESGRLDALLIALVNARAAALDVARDAAALFLLLTTRPTGAMA